MAQIIGVRFKEVGKVYYFDPCGIQTAIGTHVIVETSRGTEYGTVAIANKDVPDGQVLKPLKRLVRIATRSDERVIETNRKRAKEAFAICEQKIAEHGLDMKLVSVEYTFDLSKVLFYFTADGRVDFRELVKDLASVFRTRIELRQIGVRDEAKVLGGLGICGRPLCCASFLNDFQPVSINMAKQQNLSLNPTKISGTCGRLMCCLKYEQETYEALSRVTPRPESTVQTPDGVGFVLSNSLLRGLCTVQLEDDPDTPRIYPCAECEVLQQPGRGRKRSQRPAPTHPPVYAHKQEEKCEEPLPELMFREEIAGAEPSGTPEKKEAPERRRRSRRRQKNAEGAQRTSEKEKQGKPEKQEKQEKQEKRENSAKSGDKRRENRPRRRPRREKRAQEQAEKPVSGQEAGARTALRRDNRPAEGSAEFVDANRTEGRAPRRRRPRRKPKENSDAE